MTLPDTPAPRPDPVLVAEIRELEEIAEGKRASARRHLTWSLLGVSPAALLPMVIGIDQVGFAAMLILSVLVVGTEAWRSVRDRADADEAEAQAAELRAGREDAG